MRLDKRDIRLLELLALNCRFSLKSLAKAVKLSKDAVRYRINNLIKKKIIYKFLALTNFSSLGYDQYYVGLQLQNLTPKKEKDIITKMKKHPFLFLLVKTAGRFNFYIGLACKDVQHFDTLLREIYTICSNNLLDSESVVWIKDYKYNHTIKGLKVGTDLDQKKRDASFSKELFQKQKEFKRTKTEIDKKDRQILGILSTTPRIELKKIGEKINLTGEATRNRIANLIKKNVLLGFSAVPNYFNLGYQTYFLFIQAKDLTTENEKRIATFLQQKEYTVISFKVVGKYDILISISVKNLTEFNQVLAELKNEFSDIIKTYEALPILNWEKYTLFPEGFHE